MSNRYDALVTLARGRDEALPRLYANWNSLDNNRPLRHNVIYSLRFRLNRKLNGRLKYG
ncbi:MAG: hypothetical protein ABH844_03435 [Candidatus Omnitrophota bacterium]